MANVTFEFNRTKAIEAILYLSRRISDSNVYGICKLLYLTDKTSLEKYGRFIFGESYFALPEGATPSNAYDLLKEATRTSISGLKVKDNQVIALRESQFDQLSKSDLECLDKIIDIYGDKPNWYRAKDTHDDAYNKSWEKRGDKQSIMIPVESIAELFANSDDLVDYLSNVG
jgi:uncharacterized phage-associated protein